MNSLKFDNPAQTLITGAFTLLIAALLNYVLDNFHTNIAYVGFLAFVLLFLVVIGHVIRFGHYLDFLMSPERKMRGLYAEYYFDDRTPRISIFRMSYSTKTRRFSVNGISFHAPDPQHLKFHPHSRWNSTGVVLRYVDNDISGVFYTYKGIHLVGQNPLYPGYTWHTVSNASEWAGYFSDIEAPVHSRTHFRIARFSIKAGGPEWLAGIGSPDADLFEHFARDEHAGADFLNSLLPASTAPANPPSVSLPSGLTKWLTSIPSGAVVPVPVPAKTPDEIVDGLFAVAANAYAEYSHFKVACCITTSSNRQYFGGNCENASYPQGLCAEAVAIGAMTSAGDREIAEVYLHAAHDSDVVPCGGCLQRLMEFSTPRTALHIVTSDRKVTTQPLGKLLPSHFKL